MGCSCGSPGVSAGHHRLAASLAPQVDLRAVPATAPTERLHRRPPFGTGGVLVCPDNRAVDGVRAPVQPARSIRLLLQRREGAVPHPGPLPPVDAARDRLPRTVALGQGAPRAARRGTHKMPSRTVRWSLAGRPVRGFRGGSKGRSRSHCGCVKSLDSYRAAYAATGFADAPEAEHLSGGPGSWRAEARADACRGAGGTAHSVHTFCRTASTSAALRSRVRYPIGTRVQPLRSVGGEPCACRDRSTDQPRRGGRKRGVRVSTSLLAPGGHPAQPWGAHPLSREQASWSDRTQESPPDFVPQRTPACAWSATQPDGSPP